ncbi:MAG: hypothetical protein AB8I69_07100 [Anaerolineae bacterium]
MEIGLLWFDDNKKKSLEEKVNEAKAAYCAKSRFSGQKPDTCFVHRSMLPEGQDTAQMDGVRIAASATIPPYHFFIGVVGVTKPSHKKKRKRSKSRKRKG